MASYWKSNPRYFCDICKCWLSDNKASIEFHERGKSHKEKKERHISELRKRSAQEYKNHEKAGLYLRQMEDAAVQAYKKDLAKQGIIYEDTLPNRSSRPSAGLHSYHFVDAPTSKKTSKQKQKDPQKPPMKSPWSKQTSPEGQVYYWNSETGKSCWEKPEDFVEELGNSTSSDQQGKVPGESSKDTKSSKSPWVKQVSPEGQSYYWNTDTGKSQWEKPKDFEEKTVEKGNTQGPESEVSNKGEVPGNSQSESKDSWTEQTSPDGNTYYWNSETGKSQWVKPDGFVPKLNLKPVDNKRDGESPDPMGAEPAKKPRRDPYGSWSVIRQPKPKKQIDWQLPKKGPEAANEGLVDRTALENSDVPEPPKFKEKVVPSLGGEGGSTVFKKKGAKQRSIRRRNDDD